MTNLQPIDIENAVVELCASFNNVSYDDRQICHSEGGLWQGMTTCVLSSQVGYETATVFSQELAQSDLLPPSFEDDFGLSHEQHLYETLSTPLFVVSKPKRYRFPKAKARQIAKTAEHFFINQLSLTEIFANDNDPKSIRGQLIEHVTGLGPKQASMFIRDAKKSENLAIIDRHILDYMNILGLATIDDVKKFNASKYFDFEVELEKYANFLNFPVGRLDWAIWIVMRTLKKGKLH